MLQKAVYIKNTVVLIFQHIHYLHLMSSELAWVLVSSETQLQLQIMLALECLPDYLSVSYDYGRNSNRNISIFLQSIVCYYQLHLHG